MPRGNAAQNIKSMVNQAQERAKKPIERNVKFDPAEFVSTGSTLLNLALTDHPKCGWQRGKMANIIGDSSSGKTFLTLTAFAEASKDKRFDNCRLIFDDAEHANEFDVSNLFGDAVEERLEPPEYASDGTVRNSTVIEDFHANVRAAAKEGSDFIYILDSMDALDSEDDQKKIDEMHTHRLKMIKAEEDGKELKALSGSYGMAKAKKNSQILRDIIGKIKKANGILLIISQTRDNIDPMSFSKKTRSGGKALKFYATHEVWTANGKTIKVKERPVGVLCRVKVSKNKITGKVRDVEFPIYYEFGIDNIGSCIDFLIKEKIWSQAKGGTKIDTGDDLGMTPCTRTALIKAIETNNLESKLDRIVANAWKEIEDSLKQNRKKRY